MFLISINISRESLKNDSETLVIVSVIAKLSFCTEGNMSGS